MQAIALADETPTKRAAEANSATTTVVRWIASTVGTILMYKSQTPYPRIALLCLMAVDLSTFHEASKLQYQSIEAQEYSARKPQQAKPRPVEIFT